MFPSDTGTIVLKWDWNDCSQVTLAQLLTSDIGTIVPKWHWHDCSQVTLARFFPSDTGTIIPKWNYLILPKWHWHNCPQVILAPLFPSDSGTIVPKWDWHDCSQVTLLFPSGFWLSNLYFVLQFVLWHNSSLVGFTWEKLCHVPGLWHIIPKMGQKQGFLKFIEKFGHWSSLNLFNNESLYYFLCSCKNPIFGKIFVSEILAKMFSANQIAGFICHPYLQNKLMK